METLKSSKFIDITFDSEHRIMKLVWKPETEDMNDEDFKREMLNYVDRLDKKPRRILHQMQEMKFIISPELQEWVDENVNKPAIDAGVTKAAFLLSSDIFARVSTEQTNEGENLNDISIAYFEDETEALNWLDNNE